MSPSALSFALKFTIFFAGPRTEKGRLHRVGVRRHIWCMLFAISRVYAVVLLQVSVCVFSFLFCGV